MDTNTALLSASQLVAALGAFAAKVVSCCRPAAKLQCSVALAVDFGSSPSVDDESALCLGVENVGRTVPTADWYGS